MTLVLTTLRCPDSVTPESRKVTGGEFSIGRGPDNDWVLPDPDRYLSKRHCVLAFRSGGWQVADVSANGTFLNRDDTPIGRDAPRPLRSGDRLRFGSYEIDVAITEGAQTGPRSGGLTPAMLDPFLDGPMGPQRPGLHDDGLADPFSSPEAASDGIGLPSDYDPLAPDPGNDGFRGPTQPDHAPSIDHAFRAPPPAAAVLPDDWDLDLPGAASDPAAPKRRAGPTRPPPAREAAKEPIRESGRDQLRTDPVEPAAAPSLEDDWGVISEPVPAAAAITPGPQRAVGPAPAAMPPRQQAAHPQPAVENGALLAAFLRGAGVGDARPPDPVRTMEGLGQAVRAMVAGLRQAMIARASIKGEFRIEQTMVRASGNNPLKFSAGDDDALAALLGLGRRTDMAPAAAVADALRDMRLHELATVAAMQSAVRAMLAEFAPDKLAKQTEQGGFNVLPAQKKARQWDAFEAHHARVTQALSDDFDSVFGKAFARAYEQALRDATAKEGRP